MFSSFLGRKVARKPSSRAFRMCLDALEDRTLLTVIFPVNDGFERPNLLSNGSGNYQYGVALKGSGVSPAWRGLPTTDSTHTETPLM